MKFFLLNFVLATLFLPVCSFKLRHIQCPSFVESSESVNKIADLRGGSIDSFQIMQTISKRDISVSLIVAVESVMWIKIWSAVASRGILDPKITRKVIHTSSAPLFIAHWPLYTNSPAARYLAATVPFMQVMRLCAAGVQKQDKQQDTKTDGKQYSSELIQAVSRSGANAEALGGPLIYSAVLVLGTLLFFRNSPVGIVAIANMAAGDGLADIVGRNFGRLMWPFCPSKSLLGSFTFVLSGFIVSVALLWLMNITGVLSIEMTRSTLTSVLLISVLSAAVELVPIVDDNFSVPLVAGLAAAYLL